MLGAALMFPAGGCGAGLVVPAPGRLLGIHIFEEEAL